jgi:hypothetical protein
VVNVAGGATEESSGATRNPVALDQDQHVYLLDGEHGGRVGGPYLGAAGLDMRKLALDFVRESHHEHEARGEDYCAIYDSDFCEWAIKRGIFQPLEHVSATVDLHAVGMPRYVPKHWPECPSCHEGRGDDSPGAVQHDLNRWEWFRRCTECGYEWGHRVIPHNSSRPMLEDDGRYIDSVCVPYSLSQVGGLHIDAVLPVCRQHGWHERKGMDTDAAIVAARVLGIGLEAYPLPRSSGRVTLSKVVNWLPRTGSFVIELNGHWLSVVNGENRDQAATHGGARPSIVSGGLNGSSRNHCARERQIRDYRNHRKWRASMAVLQVEQRIRNTGRGSDYFWRVRVLR